jgi:hypothetical protein
MIEGVFPENERIEGDGFNISYLPSSKSTIKIFSGDNGGTEETAIVFRHPELDENIYLILNGDFRADYRELVPQGLEACIKFYLSKPELHSSWSSGGDPVKLLALMVNNAIYPTMFELSQKEKK